MKLYIYILSIDTNPKHTMDILCINYVFFVESRIYYIWEVQSQEWQGVWVYVLRWNEVLPRRLRITGKESQSVNKW